LDKITILILLLLTISIKLFFCDSYCYEILRRKHSKSYIRKHFNVISNRIFYKDFVGDVGLLPLIINYMIICLILFLFVLFLISFFVNVRSLLNNIVIIYGIVFIVYYLILTFNFVILNKNAKGEKSGILGRIIVALVFVFLAVMYFVD